MKIDLDGEGNYADDNVTETVEQQQTRTERQKTTDGRHATMTSEQRYNLLEQRRQRHRRCNEAESSVSEQNSNHHS